jgi:hypothetical protein
MRHTITVEVETAEHGELIEEALEQDVALKTFVLVVAMLDRLPSVQARGRVLEFLADFLRVGIPDEGEENEQ